MSSGNIEKRYYVLCLVIIPMDAELNFGTFEIYPTL